MAQKIAVNTAISSEAFRVLRERSDALGISQAKLLRDILHLALGMPEEEQPLERLIRKIAREEIGNAHRLPHTMGSK